MLIFNFHHVEPTITRKSREHITITTAGLRRFIRILKALGFEPVSLKAVLAKGGPDRMDAHQVLLTFDDGYENFYHHAAPVLESESCPATVFVLPGKFSGTNDWDQCALPEDERDKLMSLEQVQALAQSDLITFGSHGMNHRPLSQIEETEIDFEIDESFLILSQTLETSFVPVLAYPWGMYNQKVVNKVSQRTYQFALTTEKGAWLNNHSPYQIPRYTIYHRDGNPFVLLAKLLSNRIMPPKLKVSSVPKQFIQWIRYAFCLIGICLNV